MRKCPSWSIEDGNWNHCDKCDTTYSEADGNCECITCSKCETVVEDEEDLYDGGLCEACAIPEDEDDGEA